MTNKLSEHDQWLLGLLNVKPGAGGEHSTVLAKLARLLRIVVAEDDLAAALAPGGRLHSAVLEAAGLSGVFDSLVKLQSERTRYRTVAESRSRTRLILLELQNHELRRQNSRLQHECYELDLQLNGGVPRSRTFELYADLVANPDRRDEIECAHHQRCEQDRLEYRQRKDREAAADARKVRQKFISRRRDKVDEPLPADWFADMPVSDPTGMSSYVQATGADRKQINTFLRSISASPVAHRRSGGRGRPLPLYGFETNLRVLDHWLASWLTQEPDRIADAVMTTLWWCLARKHTAAQAERLRQVLDRHLSRFRKRIADPGWKAEVRRWSPALKSKTAWQRMIPIAVKAWHDAELRYDQERTSREAASPDPLKAALQGVPAA